jgi:hypothetical protein
MNFLFHDGTSVTVGGNAATLIGIILVVVGTVIWQYAFRKPLAGRIVLLLVVCGFLPSAFGIERFLLYRAPTAKLQGPPPGFDLRLASDTDRQIPAEANQQHPSGSILIRIPLSVTGLKPNTLLRGNALPFNDRGQIIWFGSIERLAGQYWISGTLNKGQFDEIKQHSGGFQLPLDLNIVSDQPQLKVVHNYGKKEVFFVPGVGPCRMYDAQIACRTGLDRREEIDLIAETYSTDGHKVPSYIASQRIGSLPFTSIPFGLTPTADSEFGFSTFVAGQVIGSGSLRSEINFVPRRTIAHFQMALDLENLQLTHYALEE